MKKIGRAFQILLLSLSVIFVLGLAQNCKAFAEDVIESGEYKYIVTEDGNARITKFTNAEAEYVEVPENLDGYVVTEIGEQAFCWRKKIKNIKLPETIKSIEDEAFKDMTSISSITLPDSIEKIGKAPFCGCSQLKEITVSRSHAYLAVINGVLYSKPDKRLICCPAAKEISEYSIPDGIKIIDSFAFQDCTALTNIYIPITVESIGYNPFYLCSNLSVIDIAIGSDHFFADNGVLYSYKDKSLITYPQNKRVIEYTVCDLTERIGDYAFAENDNINTIILPESCKYIGDYAFYSALSLKNINCPDSVSYIGESAFYFASIKSFIIPSSLTEIMPRTFYSCMGLNSVIFSDGVEKIGEEAFYFCSLKTLIIPGNIKTIGEKAFTGCDTELLVLQEGVEKIEHSAFSFCKKLQSISFPDSLKTIEPYAFDECSSLSVGIAPGSVEDYDRIYAFCDNITTIVIENGVKHVNGYAFEGDRSLELLVLPDSVTYISGWCFNDDFIPTLSVNENSYAEQYAIDNGIDYIYQNEIIY